MPLPLVLDYRGQEYRILYEKIPGHYGWQGSVTIAGQLYFAKSANRKRVAEKLRAQILDAGATHTDKESP